MAAIATHVQVLIGRSEQPVGDLSFTKDGRREHSRFAYKQTWLGAQDRFALSPDLPLGRADIISKAPTKDDSAFAGAFADTEPDGWGRRVIARDHAKRREAARQEGQDRAAALTDMDFLLGVDDFSRIGAIRLADKNGKFFRAIEADGRGTPPLLELGQLMAASKAVEMKTETQADLRYLRGRGTSLGGMRPKCTVVDDDGQLAIGKFPSVGDERSVTRGEVLALHLAAAAGIHAAQSRIVISDQIPVALIRRFDRTLDGNRIPYLSAGSMMQTTRDGLHTYAQIAGCILQYGVSPAADLAELWRRIVFNLLITNVDDHVRNHGFLHVGQGQWKLAPAFDINPFPDKDQELKLSMDETTGPVSSIREVLAHASTYHLPPAQARQILGEVVTAINGWKTIASSAIVGMSAQDIDDVRAAFDHEQMDAARQLI